MEIRTSVKIDIHRRSKGRPQKASRPDGDCRVAKERGDVDTSSGGSKRAGGFIKRRVRNPDRISESSADCQLGRLSLVSPHIGRLR